MGRKKIFQKRLLQITNKHRSIVSIVFAFLTLEEFGVVLLDIEFELNEDFNEAF